MVKKNNKKDKENPCHQKKYILANSIPKTSLPSLISFSVFGAARKFLTADSGNKKKQRAGKWPRRKTREVLRKVSDSWLFVCVSFFLCFLFSNPMVFGTTIWHKKFIVFLKHDFNSIFSTKIKVETMEKTSINGDSGR